MVAVGGLQPSRMARQAQQQQQAGGLNYSNTNVAGLLLASPSRASAGVFVGGQSPLASPLARARSCMGYDVPSPTAPSSAAAMHRLSKLAPDVNPVHGEECVGPLAASSLRQDSSVMGSGRSMTNRLASFSRYCGLAAVQIGTCS